MHAPNPQSILRRAARNPGSRFFAGFLLVAVVLAGMPSLAGAYDPDESPHAVQLYVPFNGRDVALGVEYLFRPPGAPQLGLFANFAARPYHLNAHERLRPQFTIVYREVRYHGGAGLQAWAPIGAGVSLHVGLGLVFTFGDYAGTRRDPERGWTPLMRGGITYAPAASPLLLQAGYQYADLKSAGSSWAVLCAGVRF